MTDVASAKTAATARERLRFALAGARDWFRDWRNRRLADPAFQTFAARFPATRPLANDHARRLFDLCAGFVYSQTLAACVALDLFESLRDRPLDAREIAQRADLTEEAADRLARAASALGLLQERRPRTLGGPIRYGLGEGGAALLGNPSAFDMIRHHAALYEDLRDPVALFRGPRGEGALARYWGYAAGDGARDALGSNDTDAYTALMASTQGYVAEDVIAAYPVAEHKKLLDVGGGAGAFAAAAARAAPNLSATVFDLPSVAAAARNRFEALGLSDRVTAIGGDFHRDPLPAGADLISFVRVLHDHEDAAVVRLLAAARDALRPGGALLVAEPMADTRGARAMGDAYFGVYLWAMGTGRPRTRARLMEMIENAGFSNMRERRTRRPVLVRALVATRP